MPDDKKLTSENVREFLEVIEESNWEAPWVAFQKLHFVCGRRDLKSLVYGYGIDTDVSGEVGLDEVELRSDDETLKTWRV